MRTNFPLQSYIQQFGPNNLKRALVAAIEQISGKQIDIPKTLSAVSAMDIKNVKDLSVVKFFSGAQVYSNQPAGYVRPEDKHILITTLKLFSANDVANPSATYVPGLDAANANLTTGLLTIESNGVRYLEKLPLANFIEVAEQAESGVYLLPVPIPWLGQTDLTATIEFETAPTATAEIYVQLSLEGIGLQ